MVSMLPALFDNLIIELTNVAAYINASTIALIFLLSLLNAYFVFIKK